MHYSGFFHSCPKATVSNSGWDEHKVIDITDLNNVKVSVLNALVSYSKDYIIKCTRDLFIRNINTLKIYTLPYPFIYIWSAIYLLYSTNYIQNYINNAIKSIKHGSFKKLRHIPRSEEDL